MADNKIETPKVAVPSAQEAKLVGDDETQEVREVAPEVNVDQVPAQVVQPREPDADKVNVHETAVATDEVITDPASPKAVQVPDAGRGNADLPIHRLGGATVEQQFEAASEDDGDKDEPKREAPAPAPQPAPVQPPAPPAE